MCQFHVVSLLDSVPLSTDVFPITQNVVRRHSVVRGARLALVQDCERPVPVLDHYPLWLLYEERLIPHSERFQPKDLPKEEENCVFE
jgi:hypothetical protein